MVEVVHAALLASPTWVLEERAQVTLGRQKDPGQHPSPAHRGQSCLNPSPRSRARSEWSHSLPQ